MTTPLDLPAIRARLEAATPGPWHLGHCEGADHLLDVLTEPDGAELAERCLPADAAFIAAARTDVGDLLDECERLGKRVAELALDADANADERDAALAEVARLTGIIDRADHTSATALSAQWQACESENDRLTAELARLRAELDATTERCDQAERGARDLSLEVTRLGNDLRLAHDERDVARRSLKHERAQVDALRTNRLAEDAVVAAAERWTDAMRATPGMRREDRAKSEGNAVCSTVDALRAARAGKDGDRE